VNVLGHDQEALCRAFAISGDEKFDGVGYDESPFSGAARLDGCLAWVDCSIVAVHEGGDHEICLGRVEDLGVGDSAAGPLVYYRSGFGRFTS
jgi:flavin reductase (DIM6/NTAB) family NADH-FMN oxidoreductase RutF